MMIEIKNFFSLLFHETTGFVKRQIFFLFGYFFFNFPSTHTHPYYHYPFFLTLLHPFFYIYLGWRKKKTLAYNIHITLLGSLSSLSPAVWLYSEFDSFIFFLFFFCKVPEVGEIKNKIQINHESESTKKNDKFNENESLTLFFIQNMKRENNFFSMFLFLFSIFHFYIFCHSFFLHVRVCVIFKFSFIYIFRIPDIWWFFFRL